jgi:protein neuralized
MASSVAAMPHESAASWKDPAPASRGFFNILVPTPQPAPSFSATGDASAASAPTPRRRRRQILDRWAAAASAVTAAPAPRRAREAELSKLASATRPVAARAAVFREPSPAPSDASSSCAAPELPPSGPRASSLIQRWREIEAVGPATPRDAPASDSEPGCRVGSIVKRLSGPSSLPEDDLLDDAAGPPPSPRCATVNGLRPPHLLVRTVRGRRAVEELVANMAHRRSRELAALADRLVVSRFAHKGRIQVKNISLPLVVALRIFGSSYWCQS